MQEEVIIRKLLEQQKQMVKNLEKVKAEYEFLQSNESNESTLLKEKRKSIEDFENKSDKLQNEVKTRRASLDQLGGMSPLELQQKGESNARRLAELEAAQ